MLHIKSVTCIKQERCLFADLNFSLKSGQIMQLAGPNGAGKTSLLRIIAGFSAPDEGQVMWQGESIAKNYDEFARQLLFIGHKTGVNSQLSAIENLRFWLQIQGYDTEQDLYSLLAKIGLVGLEDVPVRTLSAGQQRRVALIRLWLNDAKLWVLDEPFTALDKAGIAFLQQRFLAHLAQGGAILLTTHQDLTTHFNELQTVTLEYRH
ncbi:cytochrome c biogenesis heme-transporting ATPase CcmA [Pseudoalteromonas sp. SR44-5]|uniref:Cytochrome c biogenesis heme-transporting ATPase CcmA n=1 Tax=Pseudoalteromonas rhizosphaerae TaxID=2518973 RepID=A0ABW8KXB2_9GAMM|nr:MULTISPECIES: cytochrome c biogenesis heme-transporting ATPase CcmA [Pseudoalteromonas]MBB1332943.1 cytochrome c biogenesis heme-transporting ATPase CcmA [Pseudoalteromonas sp. SR41-6]MBB1366689.1 cytochrome c biogenesis heme-transporting ATPase CcmA [Pseudoalteromonas sp. SR44-5]MBB1416996.1 cytochrome c biogenesis heme-transporting ATPase CcmA [Pseudoalteromonas sp. SG44-1]MBB1421326.1 cytochrome c biogenesis heme-transporting ATPase CcmA [Pseudoalteromonas sp. SG43-7]MBB1433450.1 cytochr